MARAVNHLVDICNGRSKQQGESTAYYTLSTGAAIQKDLLDILDWFNFWYTSVKRTGNKKYDFIPNQSWKSLQSLVLGLVGLIQHYVINKSCTFVPKRMSTDTIEMHFSCSRQNGGSGNEPTAMRQRTNDAKASTFVFTTCPSKGNNDSAPMFGGRKKY